MINHDTLLLTGGTSESRSALRALLEGRFNLLEANGQNILACTQGYTQKNSCKNGIRSVKLTSDGMEWGGYIQQDTFAYQVALLALVAQEKVGTTEYNEWTGLFEDRWDSFEAEHEGVRIVQTVDFSGYTGIGQILAPGSGVARSYLKTVTLSFTGSE